MRRREISPEFWTDEKIVEISDAAKLLFIGLWNLADREGRLEDRPKTIGFKLRPWAPGEVAGLLAELHAIGLIDRYESEGVAVVSIPKFADHQRPHPREMPSKLPSSGTSREISRPAAELHGEPGNAGTNRAGSSGSSGSSFPSGSSGPSGSGCHEVAGSPPPVERPKRSKATPPTDTPEVVALRAAWNELTTAPLPKWEAGRAKEALAALERRPLSQWREVFAKISASAFCRGESGGDRSWRADIDWALRPGGTKPEPALKVLEGAYDDRSAEPNLRGTGPVKAVVTVGGVF